MLDLKVDLFQSLPACLSVCQPTVLFICPLPLEEFTQCRILLVCTGAGSVFKMFWESVLWGVCHSWQVWRGTQNADRQPRRQVPRVRPRLLCWGEFESVDCVYCGYFYIALFFLCGCCGLTWVRWTQIPYAGFIKCRFFFYINDLRLLKNVSC